MTQQNTHHPLAESLSALMDNEASELELQRVLKASDADSEVKATWSRYQVARAALHRDLPMLEVGDFAARVSAALEQEETHTLTSTTPATPEKKAVQWWQNVARFAVAASVAGGVVLFAQNFGGVAPEAPAALAATPQADVPTTAVVPAPSLPAGYHAQPLSARAVGLQTGYESRQQDNRQVIFVPLPSSQTAAQVSDDEVRDYLNKLIEEHADNAALNSGQGMLPFARVVLTEED
ncbi:MAG TPA: sigma-E factor negative regulatory protein [Cellvibrio sp.]|nr:sigma-E factor negative regulatory protein [Cellvibrio sp.]